MWMQREVAGGQREDLQGGKEKKRAYCARYK